MGLLHRLSGRLEARCSENQPMKNTGPVAFRAGSLEELAQLAAQTSNADGAAVAMVQGGTLVCIAREGSLAPPIGATLNNSSGITGACVQSRQPLECHDADINQRVDLDVCRALGIRSIIVAPVINDGHLTGLIEVFSSEANAFEAKHTEALVRLSVQASDLLSGRMNLATAMTGATAVKPSLDDLCASPSAQEQQAHTADSKGRNAGIGDFLEVLQSPSSATWDELSNELARRMKLR